MIVIDGSYGEGGGQIFRTTISLAMCLGLAVRIENIRAGRRKPGLLRQHLTALRAAQQVCRAEVSGAELGSMTVTFAPGAIEAGHYECAIGSAGSTTLVFQTLVPALQVANAPSTVRFEGGTHNGSAPSVDFLQLAFLPLLARLGLNVSIDFRRHGFYPAGGGLWQCRIEPCAKLGRLELPERGEAISVEAVVSCAQIPGHVAERQLARVQKKLRWSAEQLQRRSVESVGPGNIVSLRLGYEHVVEVFEAMGAPGLPAERVAGRALSALRSYQSKEAAVGEFLCDQLLLPLALGEGGAFTTGELSEHARTNMHVIESMLGRSFRVTEAGQGVVEVSI